MTAFLLTIAMYHVVPIVFPAWYGTPGENRPPSIAANGNVAVPLQTDDRFSRIGILRADGTTTLLSLPPAAAIAHEIEVESPPSFTAALFASDGTPFVSVSSCFEAVGGGGCRTALFAWNGAWHAVPHPQSDDQFSVAGAGALGTYVLEDDFSGGSAVGDSGGHPAPGAFWYRAKEHPYLASFDARAVRGRYLVGTESYGTPDPNGPVASPSPTPAPHAIEYTGAARVQLGVGVANAVNASGDVVGDDEPQPGSSGSPMLWSNGRAIALSSAKGTADAINDAGLIAGTAGGHPFLTDEHDPKHRVYALDDLLVDKKWHVDSELGIASSGRILAYAHRAGGSRQVVVLDPLRLAKATAHPAIAALPSRA